MEEIDSLIEEVSEQLAILEKIIGKVPKMPAVPGGLAAFAMTPLSVYGTLQDHLAAYKTRRMKLMTEIDSQARLKYELDKAIESENFERAAELNDKLNQ
jgi:hypothetical protein